MTEADAVPELEDHWDPPPDERTYYREGGGGQLGWLVRRNGRDCIRLDRATQELIVPIKGWEPDTSHKPLTLAHVAQVTFEADRALCRYIGIQAQTRKQWIDMREPERIDWMKHGPDTADPIRRSLYVSIRAAMKGFTQ